MRRVWRIFIGGATAGSLILFLATAALWGRSYAGRDVFTVRVAQGTSWSIESPRGAIQVAGLGNLPAPRELGWVVGPPSDPMIEKTRLGFGWARTSFPSYNGNAVGWRTVRITAVVVPDAAILLVTALPLAAYLFKLIRRRTRPGCCAACGYDLRATPGRCPECGMIPFAAVTADEPASKSGAATTTRPNI